MLGIASGYTAEIAKANDALRQTMFGTGSLVEELEKRFAFSTKPPSDLFPHLVSQHTAKLLGIQTAAVFEESFSGELLERLQRFKSVTSHVEQETILEEFFLWMVEKFSELLQTFYSLVVTRDIIVGTFLLFLSLILNRNSASKDDLFELAHHFKESLALVEQSSEKNTRLLEEASRELAELRSVTNFHRNYVVIKPVHERNRQTASGYSRDPERTV